MAARASRVFVSVLLGLLVFATVSTACIYWNIYGYPKLFGDFDTFRKAALHAVTGELPAVYDVARVRHLFETGGIKDFAFFLNPPTGLFVVWPLAFMTRGVALAFWTLAQFALLFAVLRTEYVRRMFAPKMPDAVGTGPLLGICFIAFCLQNVLYGQVAVLCCAMLLMVLAWRNSRPVLAGVLLGIFSFKPQLGVLLPVLLLAEKNWKVLLWAALTAGIMILLSLGLWGTSLWTDYRQMVGIRAEFLAADPSLLFAISISAYAAIRNLGASAVGGFACQGAIALAVIVSFWTALKNADEARKLELLVLSTYLVTPYALVYDMPLLALPCALLLRRAEADSATRGELIALLLLVLIPVLALLLQIAHIPYTVIAIGFALIVARMLNSTEKHG